MAAVSDPPTLSYFFLLPSYFYFRRANHSHCATAFCSVRPGWSDLAFACFALPRGHRPPASTSLGREHECLDDQLLGRFFPLFHLAAFLLGRISFSIRPDWNSGWRPSRIARSGAHALGRPSRRTFLYSEPLARTHRCIRDRSTCPLRLVARYAHWKQPGRSTVANHGLRHAVFAGGRCGFNRLLSDLLHWSAVAPHPPRATSRITCH